MVIILKLLLVFFEVVRSFKVHCFIKERPTTISLQELAAHYEDDKNAVISISLKDDINYYEYFYDELDNRMKLEQSMNMIYFGPPNSFLRMDPETVLHLLMHTKRHLIPKSRVLLAWDLITDGKTAAFLRAREYLAFGSLLNVVPEEDLYFVNFGDPAVLNYFATHMELQTRKLGILLSAYLRYYGNTWHSNGTYINEMGYLICGFPSYNLIKHITPKVFVELSVESMKKFVKCSPDQVETFYKIAVHPDAYHEPYTWSTYEISRLDMLFICIPQNDIGSLQLEAVQAIPSDVMLNIDQRKLQFFTEEQILSMNKRARRIFFLRVQLSRSMDMTKLGCGHKETAHLVLAVIALLLFYCLN